MYPSFKGFSNSCCLGSVFLVFLCSAVGVSLILLQRGSSWPSSTIEDNTAFGAPVGPVVSTVQGNNDVEQSIYEKATLVEDIMPIISSSQNCRNKYLQGITLVVTYIDEYDFTSIPLLYQLYKQDFGKMLFCLPSKPSKKLPVSVETVVLSMDHGLIPYGCFAEAVQRYPNSSGFLYMRDTVILNVWNLESLDQDKIWESRSKLSSEHMFREVRDIATIWWTTIWGMPACEAAYAHLIKLGSESKLETSTSRNNTDIWDVQNALNSLLWNGKGEIKCFRKTSSIFYLPNKLRSHFVDIAKVFYERRTFTDIAIPTILRMTELEENFEFMGGVDLGDIYGEDSPELDESLFWKHYSNKLVFISPMIFKPKNKMHSEENRSKVNKLIEYIQTIREHNYCKESG